MAGVVRTVHVKEGEQAAVGQLVLSIETMDKVKEATAEPAPTTAREPIESAPPASSKVSTGEVVDFEQHTAQSEPAAATIAASPAVRRLAREMGVDIVQVKGSGPRGRISAGDVREHAQRRLGKDQQPMQMPSLPDFSRWGKVERQKFSNVRRATARQMSRSWSAIPHVTQHDCADITNFETGRRRYADLVEAEGIKLTVTVVALRVLASALRRFPQFNASLDVDRQETILKHYVNLGVAVGHSQRLVGAGDPGCGSQEHFGIGPGSAPIGRPRPRAEAFARGNAGRDFHLDQPGGHRRDFLHPNYQLARGCGSGPLPGGTPTPPGGRSMGIAFDGFRSRSPTTTG